ncbi:hypothetical protein [Trebonia kvetii]|uniref:hypothetical protein n=1 Tax=Trebonia kvetii TaxID=2480626 RepID=UPI001C9EA03F|nr:hypothetical protein [Trebonia kvetii]
MHQRPAGTRWRGFAAEARDAVTPRAFLLVCGIGLLQLAFIASYIGAFHRPAPHQIPVSVTAPAAAAAGRAAAQLSALPGDPLDATAVPDRATGLSKLRDRSSYGVLEISVSGNTDRLTVASAAGTSTVNALTSVLQTTEARSGRRLTVVDIRPPASGDHNGLSAFYLVIGWMIGGYLAASLLGLSSGARSANVNRITIRLIALALYAAVTALLGALIVGPWLHALPTDTLGLWGIGTLVVFAAGAFTTALMTMAGIIGIGIAILLFVIAGNPSAGGAYGWPLLPPFWAAIGPWLPPGAGTDAVRGAAYFGNAGITRDLLVLGGYAAAGLVLSYATLMLLGRGHRGHRGRRRGSDAGAGPDAHGGRDADGRDFGSGPETSSEPAATGDASEPGVGPDVSGERDPGGGPGDPGGGPGRPDTAGGGDLSPSPQS